MLYGGQSLKHSLREAAEKRRNKVDAAQHQYAVRQGIV